MSKPVFAQVIDRLKTNLEAAMVERLAGLSAHVFWTMTKEQDSHIVILERGAFTTTKIANLYQSYQAQALAQSGDVIDLICAQMTKQLISFSETNWTIVNQDKIVTIDFGAPKTNPYVAVLSNGQKVGYMNMHRVFSPAMAEKRADQTEQLRTLRTKIMNFTLQRALLSIEKGVEAGERKIAAKKDKTVA